MEVLPPLPVYEAWHPLVVHFPIALLLIAPVFIVLAMLLKSQAKSMLLSALVLVIVGVLFAFLATSTGEAATDYVPDAERAIAVLNDHARLAELARNLFAGVAFVLALLTAFVWIRAEKLKHWHLVVLCLFMLAVYAAPAVVLINAAHEGGRLVHEFGARAPIGR